MNSYRGDKRRNTYKKKSGKSKAGNKSGSGKWSGKGILKNRYVLISIAVLIILTVVLSVHSCTTAGEYHVDVDASQPEIDVQLLDVNPYSRPGTETEEITGIVVHYTANPGSTAQNNRDYFEGLKDSHETKVSSHFVVGIDGEIVQCIPSSEIAYASNSRNSDTLSIECCHLDETGAFTDATYTSLVRLTGWLCYRFNITSEDVIRHYDVTGKICPKYYVDHPEAWEQFKEDVEEQIKVVEQEVLAAGEE